MSQGLHVQDSYDAGYDDRPQRQSTMRKQASSASQQQYTGVEAFGGSRLRTGVSSQGPRTQSLAPFQVTFLSCAQSCSWVCFLNHSVTFGQACPWPPELHGCYSLHGLACRDTPFMCTAEPGCVIKGRHRNGWLCLQDDLPERQSPDASRAPMRRGASVPSFDIHRSAATQLTPVDTPLSDVLFATAG